MDAKHRLPLLICAAVAAGLTAAMFLADMSRLKTSQTEESLRWARQTVSQVEALTLSARDRNEQDPLGWAIGHLAQGVEPRAIKIFKSDDRGTRPSAESYTVDHVTGIFEYTKPFPPEGDTVLHVQYIRGYRGFLNASSPFASDASVVLCFATFFLLLFGLTRTIRKPRGEDSLRIEVADWTTAAKSVLMDLGRAIKSTVEGAQAIASLSSKAFESLGNLRSRIHSGLRGIHDARRALQQSAESAKRLEALALSLLAETRKLGASESGTLSTLVRDIHAAASEVGEQSRKTSASIEKLEIEIEPWSVDADIAYHAFDNMAGAIDGMNQGIRGTKAYVLENARKVSELRTEMLETDSKKPA